MELEAAVQRDMQNPVRWYQLGVKQQENEREQSAILAIRRAVELDPSYLEAWLALAISHTNEGDNLSADNAIEQWIYHNQRYNGEKLLGMLEQRKEQTGADRNQDLTGILMNLVRQAPDGEIDADIQTALGALLNTNEVSVYQNIILNYNLFRKEYEKAQDCFRAALSVRPNVSLTSTAILVPYTIFLRIGYCIIGLALLWQIVGGRQKLSGTMTRHWHLILHIFELGMS